MIVCFEDLATIAVVVAVIIYTFTATTNNNNDDDYDDYDEGCKNECALSWQQFRKMFL